MSSHIYKHEEKGLDEVGDRRSELGAPIKGSKQEVERLTHQWGEQADPVSNRVAADQQVGQTR